jgi:hypothetical protein
MTMSGYRVSNLLRRLTLGTAVLLTAALVASPAAGAQSPAASDQYQPQVPGNATGAPGGGGSGPGEALKGGDQTGQTGQSGQNSIAGGNNQPAGPAGAEAQHGGEGSLPFTGYPLTTLSLWVLALLAAGLAIRFGTTAYQRLRRAGAGPPSA